MVEQPGGWVSASPLPSATDLRKFYAELYYQTPQTTTYQAEYSDLDRRYKTMRCDALLHALARLGLSKGDAFLDVGAGEGFLMDAADRERYDVTGLDHSSFGVEKFVPRLRDRLVVGDVVESLSSLAASGRRFVVCSLLNVIEHVVDPAGLMESVRHAMSPGGLVAITVPNDYSRLQALLREERMIDRDHWSAPPQHLHYFNAENLVRFCQSSGFEIVDGYSDFPIELYLLHPGSNYVTDASNGPAAHRARLLHDLLIAEAGMDRYLSVYRALFSVGAGRNITLILRQATGQR